MKYSIIIPVFNRPDEVDELLQSLTAQTFKDFEVVVVEDGSTTPCEDVVRKYADRLNLKYYVKPNSGPGQTRNYGVQYSQGEYVIVLDSDVVLPEGYLLAIENEFSTLNSSTRQLVNSSTKIDAFGGPDRAHESFTPVQKAINYSMTSFFTTGGIRGGKKQMDKKFYPRSFNMGIRRELYNQLGGFSEMRFGEDIDFSIRIYESGATCRLFPEAWVWHKRRTDLKKFYKQVHNSGIARINLTKRHPGTLKLVHLLPAVFTMGTILCLMVAYLFVMMLVQAYTRMHNATDAAMALSGAEDFTFFSHALLISLSPLLLFSLIIFIDSTIRNRSLWIGFLSICASFIQLFGYGLGFIKAWWMLYVCGVKEDLQAFRDNFYK